MHVRVYEYMDRDILYSTSIYLSVSMTIIFLFHNFTIPSFAITFFSSISHVMRNFIKFLFFVGKIFLCLTLIEIHFLFSVVSQLSLNCIRRNREIWKVFPFHVFLSNLLRVLLMGIKILLFAQRWCIISLFPSEWWRVGQIAWKFVFPQYWLEGFD